MKNSLLLLLSLLCFVACSDPEPKPVLRFHDGRLRIAQFTDIHLSVNDPVSTPVADTLLAVIEKEHPDVVILTGDIVTSQPAAKGWHHIVEVMNRAGVPYAVTMGNHDPEVMQRDSIYAILEQDPLFIGEAGPELSGCGNYVLPVLASDSDRTSALLYCLDSGDYTNDWPRLGIYGWMPWDVTSWYREQSAHYTAQNGGEPLPALAFFHVPTPEFRLINEDTDMYGRNGDGSGIGSAELNSGFLLSCVEMGDVMGLFVGHDHENDYIGQHFDVALAYGRVSGFNAYGGLPRGGRIIDLYENSRSFDTWISTPTGEELLYHYPIGISEDDINHMEYLPVTSATPAEQGIAYTYYEGPYKNLKDFPHKGREVSRGTKRNFLLTDSPAEDYYGYEFEGLIRIPRRDVYLMHITCDDGALLYIDGRLVVDNGEAHSMDKSVKGKVALDEGLHDIRVIYYEDCQGEGLQIEIESLNMERQPISDDMLFVKR